MAFPCVDSGGLRAGHTERGRIGREGAVKRQGVVKAAFFAFVCVLQRRVEHTRIIQRLETDFALVAGPLQLRVGGEADAVGQIYRRKRVMPGRGQPYQHGHQQERYAEKEKPGPKLSHLLAFYPFLNQTAVFVNAAQVPESV